MELNGTRGPKKIELVHNCWPTRTNLGLWCGTVDIKSFMKLITRSPSAYQSPLAGPVLLRPWMNERPQSPQPVASAAVPKEEERCDPACLGIVVVWPNFFLAKVHIFIRFYMLEWWLFLTVSSTWLQEFINSSAAGSQDANSLKKDVGNFLKTNVNWLDVAIVKCHILCFGLPLGISFIPCATAIAACHHDRHWRAALATARTECATGPFIGFWFDPLLIFMFYLYMNQSTYIFIYIYAFSTWREMSNIQLVNGMMDWCWPDQPRIRLTLFDEWGWRPQIPW